MWSKSSITRDREGRKQARELYTGGTSKQWQEERENVS